MADAAEKERQEEIERAAASLRAASVGGFAPLLRMLIKKHKAKFPDDFDEKILNGPDKDGNTSLYHAAFVGHVEVTEVLLGQPGIDPNKKNSKEVTPLRAGLGNDNPEAAELLLEHEDADGKLEVDGSKACHQNWNPLCHASANGYIHVVNLLLRRANITGPPGAAAAAGGAAGGAAEGAAAAPAATAGSELDLQDGDGNTALFLACSGGHVRVVKSLLKAGAGINVMSKGNLSPLYGAASGGHARVVEILLNHSEKPNHALRSDEGDNALDAAVKGGHNAVAELLMEL